MSYFIGICKQKIIAKLIDINYNNLDDVHQILNLKNELSKYFKSIIQISRSINEIKGILVCLLIMPRKGEKIYERK